MSILLYIREGCLQAKLRHFFDICHILFCFFSHQTWFFPRKHISRASVLEFLLTNLPFIFTQAASLSYVEEDWRTKLNHSLRVSLMWCHGESLIILHLLPVGARGDAARPTQWETMRGENCNEDWFLNTRCPTAVGRLMHSFGDERRDNHARPEKFDAKTWFDSPCPPSLREDATTGRFEVFDETCRIESTSIIQ